jgi:DNA modification methylase/DNA-directed RNA polymerase subunit RPC12/RpoP
MAKKYTTQSLFSVEELTRAMGGFDFKEDEPVTCLGIEFENDEARRAYFREELRKKLPELKKIEGFPIGEDEDIINLSDPPYYTACPNPWLNDFIAEWEKEKEQLLKEGKRKTDFEVKEPYASDVSEGKNNPIYMAHAYHTKVPHPAIMRYILHYTQPGDIVFDGFAGSGMTGVAAQMCGSNNEVSLLNETKAVVGVRHSVCSDLSPIATLISAAYLNKFDAKEFVYKAKRILDKVENEFGWMFETLVNGKHAKVNSTIWSDVYTCPTCGKEIILWNASVDLEKNTFIEEFACPKCGTLCSKKNLEKHWETIFDPIVGDSVVVLKKVPVRVNYTLGGKRNEKDAEDFDFQLLQKCSEVKISNPYNCKLPEGEKTKSIYNSNKIEYLHQWFSIRNYVFFNRINELVKGDIFLQTWFTSVLQNGSTMYKFRLDRKGGILNGTLFIPSLTVEQNPINLLKNKLKSFSDFTYPTRGESVVELASATQLSCMADNSVDYIFVDPPFGANIMYSELSSIWEGWLRVMTNNCEEAIINKEQDKSLFDYQKLMNESLSEFYRVLKPNKWMTVEFSNTSASVWNSIQNALQGVGFIVVNVAAIDKKQGSFNAVTSTTAVKQDLIITCYKPTTNLEEKIRNEGGQKNNVWDFIQEHMSHLAVHVIKGNRTTMVIERSPKILYDRLISYYVQHGYPVPMDAQEFQQGLRERYVERDGMYFTAEQAAEYIEKKKSAPEFVPMGIIVSDEANGIEWLKNLLRNNPKTYSEISPDWMQAINGLRKGDILPELRDILEENFIEEPDGKWRIADPEKQADLDKIHLKSLLKEFNIYVEAVNKPKAKPIKNARLEAVRAGFRECYKKKDFITIIKVGDKIPQNLLQEDEQLLRYYDVATRHV